MWPDIENAGGMSAGIFGMADATLDRQGKQSRVAQPNFARGFRNYTNSFSEFAMVALVMLRPIVCNCF